MNFTNTLKSAKLVISTEEVPLIIGESGIGKTALAIKLAKDENYELVSIEGNLLKEGEIGGLPTIENYEVLDEHNNVINRKTTVYAIHTKLKEIDDKISEGSKVLLFIDEINRCEHAVMQEIMNLILNREINGYTLPKDVRILAAMNPSSKYGEDFDYQVSDMDAAQENRFVWLRMENDSSNWIKWAMQNNIHQKVIEFISTFPEYLYKKNEEDVDATPRSYERISKLLKKYDENKDSIDRAVLLNVIKGNIGSVISEELLSFIEVDAKPLISFVEALENDEIPEDIIKRIKEESHTRLYLSANNILSELKSRINIVNDKEINTYINRFIIYISFYPADLRVGIMKSIKINFEDIYKIAMQNEDFVNGYFESYKSLRG